jgi:hypothetical protein
MKPHALPSSIAGIPLLVLIIAPWANFLFATSQAADHLTDLRAQAARSSYLPAVEGSNDEEQVSLSPDSVSSELPRYAYLEDETGKSLVSVGTNWLRDPGLYLSYLRERGPPFNTSVV